jgi:UDP:flavonoid glycosyltransferase YjiC (YdhE family)
LIFFQVSIPFGGDQLSNGKECERLGIGASIPFFSLTEETLSEAVNKVLADQSYLIRYVYENTVKQV